MNNWLIYIIIPKEVEVDTATEYNLGGDNKLFGLDLSFFGYGSGKYNTTANRTDRQDKVKKLATNSNINIRRRALQAIDQEYRELFNSQQELEQKFYTIPLFEDQIQETKDIMNNKINPEYKLIQEDVEKEKIKAEKIRKEREAAQPTKEKLSGFGGRGY